MPAYHSAFNEVQVPSIGGVSILPIKTKVRGPAPLISDAATEDILDESLNLFRANCFFKNYEIKGNADRLLIYLILYVSECLNKITKTTSFAEAQKALTTHALQNFMIPGEGGFSLNALYSAPNGKVESDNLRAYISQLRQEMVLRFLDRVYPDKNLPSKWWLCFQKRKFMNKSL